MKLSFIGNQNKTTKKNNINEKSSNHLQKINIKCSIKHNKMDKNNIRTNKKNYKDKGNKKENNKINYLSETFINL